MDSSDFSSDETPEIIQLKQVNQQLTNDFNNLQKQFNEMVNSCPKIEEMNRENNKLKKQLVDANILIDDYKRRLNISVQSNNDFAQKVTSSQSSTDNLYNAQISSLKAQIDHLEKQKFKETEELKQVIRKSDTNRVQMEKENGVLKNQVSKFVTLSKNYFHLQFHDINELCEFLMHPQPQIEAQQLNTYNIPINEEDNEEKEKRYKNLYTTEKSRRKKLELEILKLQQTQETNLLTKKQQEELLKDMDRKHQNELKTIETNYKQEIAKLTTQQQIDQKKYHTVKTQTTSELMNTENKQKNKKPSKEENVENIRIVPSEIPNESAYTTQMRAQVDNLSEQLSKAEEKLDKQREKNKQSMIKIDKLQKALKQQKRRNSAITRQLEQIQYNKENDNKSFVSNEPIPIEQQNTVQTNNQQNYDNNELSSLKKSYKIIEKITEAQKEDVERLTSDRDKLLTIVMKQNQYLQNSESYIDRLSQNNDQLKKQFSLYGGSSRENNNDNEKNKRKIEWEFQEFPDSIVSIMKPIAENDCLPLETRIHHVMAVLAKWSNSIENSHNSELSKNEEAMKVAQHNLNSFVTSILSALGERKELPESDIIEKIEDLSQNNMILQQRVNELESKSRSIASANEANENMIINKLQSTIKESKAVNKRRALELRECKAAFIECQRKSQEEVETLRETNERIRKEMDELQAANDLLHEQHNTLVEQISVMKAAQEEELNEARADLESLQMQNMSNFDELHQKSTAEIKMKDKEIKSLKRQLNDAHITIEGFEESTRMTIEDVNQSKQKLEKYKSKTEEQMKTVISQKEKEKNDMEKHYKKIINELNEKVQDLQAQMAQNDHSKEASEKIRQAEDMIGELESKVVKLTYQIQQDSMASKSQIEALERTNKLLEVQNCAKLMAVETNYSMKCDEIKQKFEMEKKELLGFVAQQFRPYYDVKKELNDETVKITVKKISQELEKQKKRDNAIRTLVGAKDGQSTEDALTDMILSQYQHIVGQNQRAK